jgi:hypothetical protein
MFKYSAFGGCLASDLQIHFLRQVDVGKPDWYLRTDSRPSSHSGLFLGEAPVVGNTFVRAYRTSAGYRLDYDDTGSFEVEAGGKEIRWFPPESPDFPAVMMDICGRVLALALHASGLLSLHGSAVSLPDGVVGFLAPKYHGKSTLAHSLVAAGASLVTDDVLPLQLEEPVMARPGTQRLRLWGDSANEVSTPYLSGEYAANQKYVVESLAEAALMSEPRRLAALYLLHPVEPRAQEAAAERRQLPLMEALSRLLANTSHGPLLGGPEAPVVLERAARVVRTVPVYTLRYLRDFQRLPEVVQRVSGWHGEPLELPADSPRSLA